MIDTKRLIGAHLSTSGGYHKAIQSIAEKGGNCLQIFSSSPRTWKSASVSDETVQEFNRARKVMNIGPIYFHALYLANLAFDNETGRKSVQAMIDELTLASKMGVKGSVIHTGSFIKPQPDYPGHDVYEEVIINIRKILENTPDDTLLILENSGNKKIGQKLDELGVIIDAVESDRVKVCLDTCHLHVAGYDLSDQKKFEDFLLAFDTLIGIERLEVVHLNDSKDPFDSSRDRHENIGKGMVGIEVFKNLLNHEKTNHLPFILEVPGFDGNGPDKENIDAVKRLVE